MFKVSIALFSLFFLALSLNLTAQVFPSRENFPVWEIETSGIGMWRTYAIKVQVLSDSVFIEGAWWNMVRQTEYQTFDSIFNDSIVVDAGAYLVSGDKVYYRDPLFGAITILYDYSVNEGDELYITPAENMGIDSLLVRVMAKETVTCENGNEARRVRLRLIEPNQSGEDLVWLEGFGGISHPIIRRRCLNANCDIFYDANVLTTNQGVFSDTTMNTCLLVSASTAPYNLTSAKFWPNPISRSKLHFEIDPEDGEVEDLTVFSLLGEQMNYQSRFQGLHKGDIDVRNLKNGTYVFRLRLKNGKQATGKFQVLR